MLCVPTNWPEDDFSCQASGADTLFPETTALTSPGLGRQTLGSYWLLPQGWHCRFFVMWALVVALLSHLSPHASPSHALCFDMDLYLLIARDISIEGNDFVH